MNTAVHALPAASVNTKPLWAAVSVLGVAVLALGASLIYVQTRPADGHTALAQLEQPVMQAAATPAADTSLPVSAVAPGETVVPTKPAMPAARSAPVAKTRSQPAEVTRPAPPRPVAASQPAADPYPMSAPAPVVAATPTPQPDAAPVVIRETGPVAAQDVYQPRAICASCGRVEAVTAFERKGQGAGVGTVAGGVLGAVVGNQIGKGSGRAIATILGAVGGGVAGNAIEKNMNRETVYRVQVRMDDGSIRTVEQSSPPAIGAAVIVDEDGMRPAHGSAMPSRPQPRTVAPQGRVYSSERV